MPEKFKLSDVHAAMEQFFEPSVTLKHWSARKRFTLSKITEFPLFKQFRKEAGIDGSITDEKFDTFCVAASNHGYSVTVEHGHAFGF